ncbi:Uncharacterised protein [uncultured archaeon]|nr:Uncharacterised protein [uncultured archaeon]
MKRHSMITLGVIILVVIVALSVIYFRSLNPGVPADIAKCIGDKSELYVKLGCTHCEDQKKMFGDSYQYLKTIDCFYNLDLCLNKSIQATPTWIIEGKQYVGLQQIETLQRVTGC